MLLTTKEAEELVMSLVVAKVREIRTLDPSIEGQCKMFSDIANALVPITTPRQPKLDRDLLKLWTQEISTQVGDLAKNLVPDNPQDPRQRKIEIDDLINQLKRTYAYKLVKIGTKKTNYKWEIIFAFGLVGAAAAAVASILCDGEKPAAAQARLEAEAEEKKNQANQGG